ncbi:MAG: tRNA (guanosine(46)-N7)-methyltransferase TrmB [Clostridia bacterium]
MRMRNNPKADEILASNKDLIILNPEENKGKWNEVFGNNNEIHIEIGMGKGDYISNKALQNKNINYIGIELSKSVVVVAINKFRAFQEEKQDKVPNLRIMSVDAAKLGDIFNKNEVDKIYLNFSDPWPRKKHAKRRLTFKTFLDVYKEIEIENGVVEFKTDNRGLFEYSIESMNNYGMKFEQIFLDLHKTEEENIMTEYERKFSEFGPIYKMVARF